MRRLDPEDIAGLPVPPLVPLAKQRELQTENPGCLQSWPSKLPGMFFGGFFAFRSFQKALLGGSRALLFR